MLARPTWLKLKLLTMLLESSTESFSDLTKPGTPLIGIETCAHQRTKAGKINKLTVGGKSYVGESVKDDFYDSISTLKTKDNETLAMNPYFRDFSSDYQNILEI